MTRTGRTFGNDPTPPWVPAGTPGPADASGSRARRSSASAPVHCVVGSPRPFTRRPCPSLPRGGSGLWPPASACALLPVRSCILSEVSTRSRSKLPAGKNVLLLGKWPPPRSALPGPTPAGVRVRPPACPPALCGLPGLTPPRRPTSR